MKTLPHACEERAGRSREFVGGNVIYCLTLVIEPDFLEAEPDLARRRLSDQDVAALDRPLEDRPRRAKREFGR